MDKLLQRALDFEKEGMSFFEAAGKRTKHQLARGIFEILREQEKRHIEIINQLWHDLSAQKAWPAKITVAEKATDFKKLFEEAKLHLSRDIQPHSDDLAALEKGLDLERRGREMYADLARQAQDQYERAFYDIMAKEEDKHYDFIDRTFEYFSNRGLRMDGDAG